MKEVFKKIKERLKEKENEAVLKAPLTNDLSNKEYQKWMMKSFGFKEAIKIVNQVEEEFNQSLANNNQSLTNGGWIPCSERLPEETLNSVIGWDEYRNRCVFVQYLGGRFILGNDIDSVKIIAWQPLPEPYKGE